MNVHSTNVAVAAAVQSAEARVAKYDWPKHSEELNSHGCTVIEQILSPQECREIAGLYPQEGHFRSHVHMARHGFGKGEYRYFKYPLARLGLRPADCALSAPGWCRQRVE